MLKTPLESRAKCIPECGQKNAYAHNAPQLSASLRPAPELTEGHIHVWTVRRLPGSSSDYLPLLSKEEFDRASVMRSPELFHRFVADHGTLRLLLSAYLEADPQTLPLVVDHYGKPALNIPRCRLRFNMSHSGKLTMIALCLDSEIGIDVEAIRPIVEWEDIAATHFSSHERESLQAEDPKGRESAFFRCWTRKEAVIKAVGMGLSIPLDSFTVNTSLTEPAALLHCAWDPEAISRWSLVHLEPATGHVGALAVQGANLSVQQFNWPSEYTENYS